MHTPIQMTGIRLSKNGINQNSWTPAAHIFDIICKNKQKKTVKFNIVFMADKTALMTLTDVSDRVAAKQANLSSQKTLNSIFKAAPTGIGMVNDRCIVKVNERLCQMVGYHEDELVGQSARIFYPTDEEYDYVGKEKYHQISQKGTGTVETRWQHKNGQIIHVVLSSTPVNTQDWSEGITFAALDISDRKETELALKQSEARYREYFDEIQSGAFITRPDGTLIDCNLEYIRMFGFASKQEALQKNVISLYFPSLQRSEFIHRLKNNKKLKNFESRMLKTDGTPIHIMENAAGVFNARGELEMIRGYLSDITEVKKMESQLRQAQKMEAIGTLVGGISHDFNNLIQAISGYTELLKMDKDPAHPDYEHIRALGRVSQRAGDLVRQLLIFSREAETKQKPVDVNKEIRQVKNLLEKTIPKMVSIQLKLKKDISLIYADPLQIEQVLLNLGVNAADAMPQGGTLTFQTDNIEFAPGTIDNNLDLSPGRYIRLSVQDTGVGMDNAVKEKIFEPFFTTKPIEKGTGLGLSSVYGIISKHNGAITCQSQKDKGTTFFIYVPVFEGELSKKENQNQELVKKGKETVLLVDDEIAIQEIASRAFHRMGYTLVSANTGEEAVRVYETLKTKIDLVILDLSMPGMGGYQCLKKLLAINPGVKVLIASGYSAEATIDDCMALGAMGYIQKPYQMNHLFSDIRNILDQ
jgi:two-component system cell cycle sensor histidine kinase/response regulator CckA